MKIREFLKKHRIEQADFAGQIGISPQAVSCFCLGKRIPRSDVMRKIFDATNGAVTPNDFFDLPVNTASDVVSAAAEPAADGMAEGIAAFPADDAEPSFFDYSQNGGGKTNA